MLAVETRGLSKRFGTFESLRDCSLQVRAGSVFGLLGPNGAGKSTLIRTLLGFLRPTCGSATVLGHDVRTASLDIRRNVSYLPGDARLYRAMRGRSVIELFSEMHPCGNKLGSLAIAERLELDVRRRVAFMSTGMRQKLAISIVLGCQAPLLILDEPTANLDPDVRREVLELVRETQSTGSTILLSSHLFSDIESTCDEIALLRLGQLVATERLGDRPESHIVCGWTAKDRLTQIEQAFEFKSVKRYGFERQSNHPDRVDVTVELIGDPNAWMPWLAEVCRIQDVIIRRAGIEAFYDRVSAEAASAEVEA